MKHILCTGASGFLGRHLVRELEAQGHAVTKMNSATTYMPASYDEIYHLAAWTQAGDFCLHHPGEQWLINQKVNTEALTFWREFSPNARFITIGTSCAYAPGTNLKEEDYMKGEPHESLYTYAMTKRMLYEGCRALSKQYGMKYLYLIPSTLYGPDYHRDGRQAHFIHDLIRKIIRGKELGEDVVLWGNGEQIREVIYVKNMIDVMLAYEEGIYNVHGFVATIKEFASLIAKEVGYNENLIRYDSDAFVGAKNKSFGASAYKELNGLTETIKWYYDTGAWND